MSGSSRQMFFATVVVLLLVALGVWWYLGFSLDFMRFFASESDLTDTDGRSPSPSPSTLLPPTDRGVVQCAPATQTVQVGVQATLTATAGAGLYTWYAPEGTPPGASDGSVPGARFMVSYAVPGIKKVTVQSPRVVNGVNDPANPIIDSVACTVIVTP